MANENAKIDDNSRSTLLGVTDDSNAEIRRLVVDSTTGRLKVSATLNGELGKVLISSNDTTKGYLNGKLVAGTNITLTENNDGGDETLTISASGGSGDVTKVGTPADNQIGVWTGDGTIEGDSNFTWDGTTLTTKYISAAPSRTSTYNKVFKSLVSDLQDDDAVQFVFGKEEAYQNQAEFNFYKKTDTGDNYVDFGFYGVSSVLTINASSQVGINTNSPSEALTVNGNIAISGTVDGRDVATDGSKLDGIEAGADVTDATNVNAAGALMDSELTDITFVKALSDASSADVNTGTSTTACITPDALAGSVIGTKNIQIKVCDDATTLTTGDGKLIFCIPVELNGMNLVDADAMVSTVSSSGTPTFQIRNVTDSQDMLSTAITIDPNEYTSYTAATAPVINTTYDDVATGDRIAIDCDTAGTGTKGATILLSFRLP